MASFEEGLAGLRDGVLGSGGIGLIGNIFIVLIGLVIIGSILAVIAYFIVMKIKYKYKVIIFEKINGRYEAARKDSAAETKFGEAGDMVLKLKKNKKILPMPTLQMGRRTYWFAIREDGEWINIGIQDLDEKSKEVGVEFLDKEMRYARTQIQRGLKDRYDQVGFWGKYGQMIMTIAFVTIIGIMTYLLFDKYIELAGKVGSMLEQAIEVGELQRSILSGLDNVCSGSGISKA